MKQSRKKRNISLKKNKGGQTDIEMELIDSEDHFINLASRCTRFFYIILKKIHDIIVTIHDNFNEITVNENGYEDDEEEFIIYRTYPKDNDLKIQNIQHNYNLIGDRLVLLVDYERVDENQSILYHTLYTNIQQLNLFANNRLLSMHGRANNILFNLNNLLNFPEMFNIILLREKIRNFTVCRNQSRELLDFFDTISQYEDDMYLYIITLDENLREQEQEHEQEEEEEEEEDEDD